MRVVLDTNILVSALLTPAGVSAAIHAAWLDGAFTLLFCGEQMFELRSTLRKPKIAERVRPHEVGRMINNLDRLAEVLERLPDVKRSADPEDDFLLAMSEKGRADYLVTGDKSGLLSLVRHRGTRIVAAKEFTQKFL